MPQHLDQPTRAAPEHVEITAMRVATQPLLHQQRQTLHALAHVRLARGEPHPHAAGQRDHRSALSAAATRAAGADGAMPARAPQGGSTTLQPDVCDPAAGAPAIPGCTKPGASTPDTSSARSGTHESE